MKSLTEFVYESVFGAKPYQVAWTILDKVCELTRSDKREKNFGVKFDEVGGNLIAHLWHYLKSMQELEQNGYVEKYNDGWRVLLRTTSYHNGLPCDEFEPIDIFIPDSRTDIRKITAKMIETETKAACERLKKKIKLY